MTHPPYVSLTSDGRIPDFLAGIHKTGQRIKEGEFTPYKVNLICSTAGYEMVVAAATGGALSSHTPAEWLARSKSELVKS